MNIIGLVILSIYIVIYDWFERESGSQYELDITQKQYDEMKTILSPKS